MNTNLLRCLAFVLAFALSSFGLSAHAQQARAEPKIEGILDQSRVTTDANGKESLAAADKVKPGDLIEYRVRYSNKGAVAVADFAVTLPIPKGLEYVAQTDSPRAALASVDGNKFEAMPLMRTVQKPDGKEAREPIPLSEYRALRWQVGQLGAGKSMQFAARAKVDAAAVANSQ